MLTLINTAYFQTFVESLGDGVVVINADGEIYLANIAAAELLGRPREELLGMKGTLAFQGLENVELYSNFLKHALQRLPLAPLVQMRYQRPDGQVLYLKISASNLVDHDKLFGILISINDVTPLVTLHEREKAILHERGVLQRERFEALLNLSRAVAHQIRNPTMTIGGFANLLLRRSSCDKNYLEAIVSAGQRLEGIVDAVAAYTALPQAELQATDLQQMLRQCRESLDSALSQRVVWDEQLQPVELELDPALFCQALRELVVNSLEAGETGKVSSVVLSIRGQVAGNKYVLEVLDNGPGFSAEALPYATDPFFTTKAVGVGMGLSKVDKIIGEHRGRLHLANRPEGGADVSIELPLREAGRASGARDA